jgi:hypothetical protein
VLFGPLRDESDAGFAEGEAETIAWRNRKRD